MSVQNFFGSATPVVQTLLRKSEVFGLFNDLDFMLGRFATKIADGEVRIVPLELHPEFTQREQVFFDKNTAELNQEFSVDKRFFLKNPYYVGVLLIDEFVDLLKAESDAFDHVDVCTIESSIYFEGLALLDMPLDEDGNLLEYFVPDRYRQFVRSLACHGLYAMCCEYRDMIQGIVGSNEVYKAVDDLYDWGRVDPSQHD